MVHRTHVSSRLSALLLAVAVTAGMLIVAGCAPDVAEEPVTPPATQPPSAAETPAPPGAPAEEEPAASAFPWLDVELEDVQTGERFRISDFRGRPVLVKSFAVW